LKPRNSVLFMLNSLLQFGEELVLPEASEDFADMFPVFFRVLGKDEDVVEVYYYEHIQAVSKDSVHQTLEGSQSVG